MRATTVQQAFTRISTGPLWGLVMIGLLVSNPSIGNHQVALFATELAPVSAATIPLDSITLGAVIQINGQNFVKIGDNRYLSICGIESNKCPVKGQEYNEATGKCVCTTATASIQNWTGCSSLSVWQEGTSIADNSNTVCLVNARDGIFYETHRHSDNSCYLTNSTTNTSIKFNLVCPDGYLYSSTLNACYQPNGCTNPTAYMQNWTGCNDLTAWSATVTSGTTVCLADQRDGKTYMVRKLPDNRCWMVNNLAYGASDKYGFDVCANRTTMTNAKSEANIKDKFGGQDNSTTAYDIWGDCRGNSDIAAANRDGYYYNWPAAMGQTNTWLDSSTQPTYQTNVQGLCPTGWVLPTGGTGATTDFQKLAVAVNGTYASSYNGTTTKNFFQNSSYGWHGLYSGYTYGTGGLYNQGSGAYYWSSTFNNASGAYSLNYNSSYVYPEYYNDKNYGYSIRCLKQ